MNESIFSILQNFGAFGLAMFVVGGSFWMVWKKIIEPQQQEARKDRDKHNETLNRIIEKHEETTDRHINAEEENIKALQELNSKIKIHHEEMRMNHKLHQEEIKLIPDKIAIKVRQRRK